MTSSVSRPILQLAGISIIRECYRYSLPLCQGSPLGGCNKMAAYQTLAHSRQSLCISLEVPTRDGRFLALFFVRLLREGQIGKIQEESTAEAAEGRREKREETKYQFFSATLRGLCG
jgi:hypothetical protein